MTIEQFLNNATHIKELYVKDSRHWSSYPLEGYSLKSREEILNKEVAEIKEEKTEKKSKKK